MTVSQKLVAGDTLSQDIAAPTDADGNAYAATTWTLTYRLIPRSALLSVIEITAASDGDDYTLAASAATTAAWSAGWYAVAAYVTSGSETYTVEPAFSQVQILADPRTAAAGTELRSQAEKALDDALQALADAQARAATVGTTGSATGGLVEYTIGERRFKYGTPQEAVEAMIKAVSYWKAEVNRERAAAALQAGLASPRQVYVRAGRV